MPKFILDKLIRDKILALHLKNNHNVTYQELGGIELKKFLVRKLHEEADEVPVAEEKTADVVEEIADVQQIINDLKLQYGIGDEELEQVRDAKFQKKGGFEKGIYIESIELPEEDKWAAYYRAAPDKYPEVRKDHLDQIAIPNIETGLYEHYKGKRYEVVGVALHSETLEPMVVYKPLYETRAPLWIRPYSMFVENLAVNGQEIPRFRKI